ncbi:MAG: hypothetical protein IPN86_03415 [Saprospiraceae bacterium]|nr:hypothetical protein [Saprospiraceae bacterium]
MQQQKELVINMTSKVISEQFNINPNEVKKLCFESFLNLEVFDSFKKILSSHGVLQETINKIENNQAFGNSEQLNEFPIYAHKTGVIKSINQKNIGNFVNMELEAGINLFYKENRLYDGVLIKKNVLSRVNKNEVIAFVYSSKDIDTKTLSNNFFNIN